MKKIRIDYYNYRMKNGRGEILLEKEDGIDKYFIPFHYVRADEVLDDDRTWYRTEDDGDFVIIYTSFNECTRRKKEKGWTSLDKLMDLSILRNENFHVCHNIYSFFLSLCPYEGETGIRKKVSACLESVKIDYAKKKYKEELALVLENPLERYEVQPDPNLVRKEMETLEHFRLMKPQSIPMSQKDGYLLHNDLYGYEHVDWEALGAKKCSRG